MKICKTAKEKEQGEPESFPHNALVHLDCIYTFVTEQEGRLRKQDRLCESRGSRTVLWNVLRGILGLDPLGVSLMTQHIQ